MILDAKPTANRDVSTAAAAAPAISTTQSVMGLLFCPLQPSIRYFGSNTHCYGCVDADENSNNNSSSNMTAANRVIPAHPIDQGSVEKVNKLMKVGISRVFRGNS